MNKAARQAMLAKGIKPPKPKRVRQKVAAPEPPAAVADAAPLPPPVDPHPAMAPAVSATFDAMSTAQKIEHLIGLALADMHRTLTTPIAENARNYSKLVDAKNTTMRMLLLTQTRVSPDRLKEPGRDKMGDLLNAIKEEQDKAPTAEEKSNGQALDFDPAF